jgi:hypothetical protein
MRVRNLGQSGFCCVYDTIQDHWLDQLKRLVVYVLLDTRGVYSSTGVEVGVKGSSSGRSSKAAKVVEDV